MNRTILIIVAILLALVLGTLLLLAAGGVGHSQTQPTTVTTQPTTQPATQTPTTEPTTVPTEPPTEPPAEDVLMPMGQVHITSSGWVSDKYSDAQVSAQWQDGAVEQQTAKIRIRGYSSTWTKKKAYNIKFTEKVDLFGMGEGKKWCLIANAYDKTLLRNSIAMEYAEALGLRYVPATQLCKVYLDGVYLGVYTAMEPAEEGKNRVNIDLDAGDFLLERNRLREEAGVTYLTTNGGLRFEMKDPETPTADQLAAIIQQVNQAEDAVRTLNHEVYAEYIDVESFVNFYIFNELIKDIDFAQYSTRYYMQEGILYAGPPWDLDLTMGNVSARSKEWKYWNYHNQDESTDRSGDSTRAYWAQKDFYMWLCADPWFQEQVRLRWQEMRLVTENLVADNGLGKNRLDVFVEAYATDMQTNFTEAGWPLGKPAGNLENQSPAKTYEGNVELLRQWLQKRMAWLDSQWLPSE